MRWFRVCSADAFQFGSLDRIRHAPDLRLEFLDEFGLLDDDLVEFVMEAFDMRQVRFDAFKPSLEFNRFHSMLITGPKKSCSWTLPELAAGRLALPHLRPVGAQDAVPLRQRAHLGTHSFAGVGERDGPRCDEGGKMLHIERLEQAETEQLGHLTNRRVLFEDFLEAA